MAPARFYTQKIFRNQDILSNEVSNVIVWEGADPELKLPPWLS